MEIRKAEEKDIKEIKKIDLYWTEANDISNIGFFTKIYQEGKILETLNNFYVLTVDDKVEAFAEVSKIPDFILEQIPEYKDYIYIAALGVDPSCLKKGHGGNLLEYISNNFDWMSLVDVAPVINYASISMFLKRGYEQIPISFVDDCDKQVILFTNKLGDKK